MSDPRSDAGARATPATDADGLKALDARGATPPGNVLDAKPSWARAPHRGFLPIGLGNRVEIASAVVRREGIRAVRRLKGPLPGPGLWRRPVPDRLLIAPQDIRTADVTLAADIYAGHLAFGGSFVDAHGRSPFELEPPSEAWAEDLHGFGWLRHLRVANNNLSRANARALLEDWIAHTGSDRTSIAWRPAVVARRILSWLAHSPLILAPPDAAFYRRFMRSFARQVAYLRRVVATGADGEARLLASIALAEAGLCADGLAAARKQGSRVLVEELNKQIFADGGHISRDPGKLVALLLDLLPLRQAYAARSAPVPPPLLHAVDRMIPMIRMFRHGDGTLALFNGMGVTEPDALATVLTYDDVRARPPSNAPHSGYQRLEAGDLLAVVETGVPPPPPFDARAHAGTLSFELSVGTQRMVVNCGRPEGRSPAANQAARSTAAHSTLVIADVSSSQFAPARLRRWFGDGIVAGPRKVSVNRADDAGSLVLQTSHDGYVGRFGLVHSRSLIVNRNGDAIRGRDSLEAGIGAKVSPVQFAMRFHLHPAVRPQVVQSGHGVLLTLPNEARWLFEVEHGLVALDESILFAAAPGARNTSQIVIEASFPETKNVNWTFRRLAADRP